MIRQPGKGDKGQDLITRQYCRPCRRGSRSGGFGGAGSSNAVLGTEGIAVVTSEEKDGETAEASWTT
jgi:hypothetical protein